MIEVVDIKDAFTTFIDRIDLVPVSQNFKRERRPFFPLSVAFKARLLGFISVGGPDFSVDVEFLTTLFGVFAYIFQCRFILSSFSLGVIDLAFPLVREQNLSTIVFTCAGVGAPFKLVTPALHNVWQWHAGNFDEHKTFVHPVLERYHANFGVGFVSDDILNAWVEQKRGNAALKFPRILSYATLAHPFHVEQSVLDYPGQAAPPAANSAAASVNELDGAPESAESSPPSPMSKLASTAEPWDWEHSSPEQNVATLIRAFSSKNVPILTGVGIKHDGLLSAGMVNVASKNNLQGEWRLKDSRAGKNFTKSVSQFTCCAYLN